MGRPKTETIETVQKQELDPIAQGYLWSGQLPEEKLASLRRINDVVYGRQPVVADEQVQTVPLTPEQQALENLRNRPREDNMAGARNQAQMAARDGRATASGGGFFGYDSPIDMIDRGGRGASGGAFQGGGRMSDIANAVTGRGPEASDGRATPSGGNNPSDLSMRSGGLYAQGGIVGLASGGMVPPTMGGRMPNLSNRDMAYQMAMQAMQPRGYAMGGYVEGPGTGTSDDIPATIYQDGQPVQEAALSDGEFVMTERAVRGAGEGDPRAGAARMYEMMRRFERGGRVG